MTELTLAAMKHVSIIDPVAPTLASGIFVLELHVEKSYQPIYGKLDLDAI